MDRQNILLPRHWLRNVREHRRLSQQEVVARMRALDPPCLLSSSQYSRLETGRRLMWELTSFQQEGLRQVLGIPVDIWQQVFGDGR